MALVIAPMATEHGLDHFLATVILAGALQIVLAALGVAKLMRCIPRRVLTGFVNALAILISTAQLPHLAGEEMPWIDYPLVDDITDTRSSKTREAGGRASRIWPRASSGAWATAR